MMMTPRDAVNGIKWTVSSIPWPVWTFFIMQFFAVTVWGVRLDSRVVVAEHEHQLLIERINTSVERLNQLDRRLILVEERQARVIESNNYQQRQIDNLIQLLSPHATPPARVPLEQQR